MKNYRGFCSCSPPRHAAAEKGALRGRHFLPETMPEVAQVIASSVPPGGLGPALAMEQVSERVHVQGGGPLSSLHRSSTKTNDIFRQITLLLTSRQQGKPPDANGTTVGPEHICYAFCEVSSRFLIAD